MTTIAYQGNASSTDNDLEAVSMRLSETNINRLQTACSRFMFSSIKQEVIQPIPFQANRTLQPSHA
ncbi:hypothetical protein PAECIP111802_03339 [Paenibacillus allorhizosphaerae]|uniref:Uncharacterized protein n=1 Tax=Paenibacillus allorhizosphaerae TaxID=2849866 RepID=A0ABM8VIX7_9BACL|nr:hypothetical protein PAECIP111802_03339 [Paenibacillus allorhizosphaerae]